MSSLTHQAALAAGGLRRHPAVIVAGRIALWAAVVLVLGRGIVSLFGGAAAGSSPQTVTEAATIAGEELPAEAATALALRFAADYLTYDADTPTDWAERIGAYGNPALAGTWDGTGRQTVTAVVPAGIEPSGPKTSTVTVAARTPTGWTHVAVPVTATSGGLAIAGPPAFVAAPPVGKAPATTKTVSDSAAAEALRPALEAFFDAYATGNRAVLDAMTTDDARLPRLDAGQLTLAAVEAAVVDAVGPAGGERQAHAVVRWADQASGAGFTQAYRLTVTRDGQRWLVGTLGADTPTATDPPANPTKEK